MTSKYIVTIIQLISEGDEQKACFQDGGCLLRFLRCERINPIWPIINSNKVEFSHFCVSCVWVGQRHWKSVVYSFEYKAGHTPSYTSHTIIICTIYIYTLEPKARVVYLIQRTRECCKWLVKRGRLYVCSLFESGKKSGVRGEKLSKHRRDQLREWSHMKRHTHGSDLLNLRLPSMVTSTALMAWATRVLHEAVCSGLQWKRVTLISFLRWLFALKSL